MEFVDQNADLTGYGLVVVPMLYLLTDAFAKKLAHLRKTAAQSSSPTGRAWSMKVISAAWGTRPMA